MYFPLIIYFSRKEDETDVTLSYSNSMSFSLSGLRFNVVSKTLVVVNGKLEPITPLIQSY